MIVNRCIRITNRMTFGCICLHPYHLRATGLFRFSKFVLSGGRGYTFPTSELFVYANLCDNTVLGGHDVPLLRRVWLKDNKQNIIYHVPYDVPLRMGQFQDVHIYINDSQGKQASFIRDKVSVTLHLKKRPFIPLNY